MIEAMRPSALALQPFAGTLSRPRSDAQRPTTTLERSIVASAASHTDASLSITTAEGDSVTISFAQDSSATYSSLVRARRGAEGAERTRQSQLSLQSSSSLQVQVQGDLNDQEMKDIQDLVQRVSQALRDFVSGDPSQAADRLSVPAGLGSLSGFQLEMHHDESVSVAVATRRSVGPMPVTPAPLEQVSANKPDATIQPLGPPQPVDPSQLDESSAPAAATGVANLAAQLADLARSRGHDLGRLHRAIRQAVRAIRPEHDARGAGALDALQGVLLQQLRLPPAEDAANPGFSPAHAASDSVLAA